MSELKDRLRELRKTTGLSQTDFAEKLGCGRGTIKNLEEGKTGISPTFADLVCRIYGCDVVWLETGDGEMFREPTIDEQIAGFVGDVLSEKGDEFQKRVMRILASLGPEGWKALSDFLDAVEKADKQ
nr:MAG TPA: Helix-turn-helix XRE-family like protein [Caudoviricetes sp.]